MVSGPKFEFFDHTADLAVWVYGATPHEVFQNAAAALYSALGTFHLKPDRVADTFRLEANSQEELLVEFLGELLYRFDARELLFDEIVIEKLEAGKLTAKLRGGQIDLPRSEPNYEIKAITYHQTRLEPHAAGWRATLILDV